MIKDDIIKFRKTIVDFGNNIINDNKDAIIILYNNIDIIIKMIENIELEKYNLIDVDKSYSHENFKKIFDEVKISDEFNLPLFLSLFRFGILSVIETVHQQKLFESEELKNPKTDITYTVTVGNNTKNNIIFGFYVLVYFIESKIRKINKNKYHYSHVGIDYEFNNRIIALMQLSFNTIVHKDSKSITYIWLINPTELDKKCYNILIQYLMINTDIYKILHGSDSLDIPYMYGTMFDNDKTKILEFTKKLVDTRFLCEYFRQSVGLDRKCSIYDALKYFGTITEEKYKDLVEVHDSMGPVQDISWNIHKMSSYHTKYALYDVLFLHHFLNDIYKKIIIQTPKLIPTYKYINPIVRFIFLERRDVSDVLADAKKDVDPINNYLIKYKGKKITLINVYNEIIKDFIIPLNNQNYIDINFILSVGYFKKSLSILFKQYIYHIITTNLKVYKNKNEKMTKIIDISSTINQLKKDDHRKIIILIDEFKKEATKKLLNLYPIY